MPSAVRLREDYSAEALRALARRSKDANQSRRLLSLAAVLDGMDRGSSGEDRRDGPPRRCTVAGSIPSTSRVWRASSTTGRRVPSLVFRRSNRLSSRRSSRRVRIVRRTASFAGVGSTSSVSSRRGSASTFIHVMSENSSRSLASPTSVARPRHPAQDERTVEAFKKTSRAR